MTTRRQFLKIGAIAGAGALMPLAAWRAFASVEAPQTPLPGSSITPFVDPVPTFVGNRATAASLIVSMQEFQQRILPASMYSSLPSLFNAGTYVWGYKVDSKPAFYPGYTIEAKRGTSTTVTYVNNLPAPSGSRLDQFLTVDQTIHWADPLKQMGSTQPYRGPIPTVVHLHGAEVPSFF